MWNNRFLWGIAALPLGVYVIVQDLNIPLIVQPQLFGLFSLLSWGQCMYYGAGRSRAWCVAILGGTLALWGALEAALVFSLRVRVFFSGKGASPFRFVLLLSERLGTGAQPSYRHGMPAGKTGVRFFEILSSVMLSISLL